MKLLTVLIILIVTVEHFYILAMEIFLWIKPRTMRVFGIDRDFTEKTKSLVANQGLYNGFLAAGLV